MTPDNKWKFACEKTTEIDYMRLVKEALQHDPECRAVLFTVHKKNMPNFPSNPCTYTLSRVEIPEGVQMGFVNPNVKMKSLGCTYGQFTGTDLYEWRIYLDDLRSKLPPKPKHVHVTVEVLP